MNCINTIHLRGQVKSTPVISRIVNIDKEIGRFEMVTNIPFTTKNGYEDIDTQVHKIVAWGKLAEDLRALELKNGQYVDVIGRLSVRKLTGANGVVSLTEIVASNITRP